MQRKAGMALIREQMVKAYTFLGMDTELPLPLDHREFFAEAARNAWMEAGKRQPGRAGPEI